MPRLLAIAQEFGIPTFVVCDSDIETSINELERAEKLSTDDTARSGKIESIRQELEKQREMKKAMARLCGLKIEDASKCETIRGDNVVMWKGVIGAEVERSFEVGEWQEAQNVVTKEYGFEDVTTKKKNAMVIAATLEELYKKKGIQSSVLIALCGRISQYAQSIQIGGKI